jgi:CRP-like cAMP-binding protein
VKGEALMDTGTGFDTNRTITIKELKKIQLFQGVTDEELQYFIDTIPYDIKYFIEKDILIEAGQHLDYIGVLLSGILHNVSSSIGGKEYINKIYEPYELIGIAACSTVNRTAPYTIIAAEESCVLWIDHEKLTGLTFMDDRPAALVRKIHPIIESILAEELFQKETLCEILMKPTVREKIITYLDIISTKKEEKTIRLDMNQIELAKYLNVSRPTLSAEMNKLRKEGIIDYKGRDMTILW